MLDNGDVNIITLLWLWQSRFVCKLRKGWMKEVSEIDHQVWVDVDQYAHGHCAQPHLDRQGKRDDIQGKVAVGYM